MAKDSKPIKKGNKFKTLLENTLVRYQRSQFLTGDLINFKKGWEKDPWIQSNPDYATKISEFIQSKDNLRISCTKSNAPGVFGSFGNYENQVSNLADITRETAPGLYIDFITVPTNLIIHIDTGINLAKVPADKRRVDNTQIKPEEVKITKTTTSTKTEINYSPERQTGTGETDKNRALLNKNVKIKGGKKWNDKKTGGGNIQKSIYSESSLKTDESLLSEAYTSIYKESLAHKVKEGDKVIFDVGHITSFKEWAFESEEEMQQLIDRNGQTATVTSIAIDDGDPNSKEVDGPYYLDIKFDDGFELQGVDEYNLEVAPPAEDPEPFTDDSPVPDNDADHAYENPSISNVNKKKINLESIQGPSGIEDPKQAYIRISSQIYNGGLEQLIDNEGGGEEGIDAVRNLIILANVFAKSSKSWPHAKGILETQLKIFEDYTDGIPPRDQWGNHNEELSEAEEMASREVDKTYSTLTKFLDKVDKDTNVYDEVSQRGDIFGVGRNKNGISQQLQKESNESPRLYNDWYPETNSLLNSLIAAGFVLESGDNGEERFKFDGNLKNFITNLTACDESNLYVKNPTGKNSWLYLVFGNSPGELASDYSGNDELLDKITTEHYNKWSTRKQPTMTEEQYYKKMNIPQKSTPQIKTESLHKNDQDLIFESYKNMYKEENFSPEGHEPGQKIGPTKPGENCKGSWGEPEDHPDHPQMPKRQDMKGWKVSDQSFTSKGSDPTQVTKWILTKGTAVIEIGEFFGDFTIKMKNCNEKKISEFNVDPNGTKFVNAHLAAAGAPSINEIGEELLAIQEDNYDPEADEANRSMGDATP